MDLNASGWSVALLTVKYGLSMVVPDEVDMKHEAFKCGMCIVKEMIVMKGEKDLLRKEVEELRKEIWRIEEGSWRI